MVMMMLQRLLAVRDGELMEAAIYWDSFTSMDCRAPLRYVIMEKRLNFLKYILEQTPGTMIKEVYEEQKSQYKKGDFVDLVDKDKDELKIKLKDSEIKDITKRKWKSLIKEKVKEKALQDLVRENSLKNKTKHNLYEKLEISEYLNSNRNT